MTERKPQGVPFETWVDRLVREAQERGEFDDLPGAGKPLPGIDDPLDEDWWVRRKIRDEHLPVDVLLPPALQLRKELAALPDAVRDLPDEAAVRAAVREVNLRVASWIRVPTGPVLPVAPADADAVVEQWRAQRRRDAATEPKPPGRASPTGSRSPSGAQRAPETVPAPARRRRRRPWRRFRARG